MLDELREMPVPQVDWAAGARSRAVGIRRRRVTMAATGTTVTALTVAVLAVLLVGRAGDRAAVVHDHPAPAPIVRTWAPSPRPTMHAVPFGAAVQVPGAEAGVTARLAHFGAETDLCAIGTCAPLQVFPPGAVVLVANSFGADVHGSTRLPVGPGTITGWAGTDVARVVVTDGKGERRTAAVAAIRTALGAGLFGATFSTYVPPFTITGYDAHGRTVGTPQRLQALTSPPGIPPSFATPTSLGPALRVGVAPLQHGMVEVTLADAGGSSSTGMPIPAADDLTRTVPLVSESGDATTQRTSVVGLAGTGIVRVVVAADGRPDATATPLPEKACGCGVYGISVIGHVGHLTVSAFDARGQLLSRWVVTRS